MVKNLLKEEYGRILVENLLKEKYGRILVENYGDVVANSLMYGNDVDDVMEKEVEKIRKSSNDEEALNLINIVALYHTADEVERLVRKYAKYEYMAEPDEIRNQATVIVIETIKELPFKENKIWQKSKPIPIKDIKNYMGWRVRNQMVEYIRLKTDPELSDKEKRIKHQIKEEQKACAQYTTLQIIKNVEKNLGHKYPNITKKEIISVMNRMSVDSLDRPNSNSSDDNRSLGDMVPDKNAVIGNEIEVFNEFLNGIRVKITENAENSGSNVDIDREKRISIAIMNSMIYKKETIVKDGKIYRVKNQSEIAKEFNMTKSAVSQRKDKLIKEIIIPYLIENGIEPREIERRIKLNSKK